MSAPAGGPGRRLPMAGGGASGAPDAGPRSGAGDAAARSSETRAGATPGQAAPAPTSSEARVDRVAAAPGAPAGTSSARLIGTLALAGALAGLLIVLVHGWSRPRIEAHQAAVLRDAVEEVLGGPERWETAFLEDGAFTTTPAADTAALDRVWVGYDDAGRPVGVAVAAAEPGFQDVIRLLFGYDPARGEVLGMKVLESKETPGLGDKIEKDSAFVAAFRGVAAPVRGVKPGRATGADDEVDMITGATISSRAVVDIINHRLDALEDPLRAMWSTGAAVAVAPGGTP